MFKLAIEVCFENHFGLIYAIFLSLRVDQIRMPFFGTPGILTLFLLNPFPRVSVLFLYIYRNLPQKLFPACVAAVEELPLYFYCLLQSCVIMHRKGFNVGVETLPDARCLLYLDRNNIV